MLLLIDNYDSFTYNLAHLFAELGAEVVVRRNDAITVEEAERLAPVAPRDLPGSRPAVGRRDLGRARAAPRPDDADARCCSPTRRRRGVRRRVGQARELLHARRAPVRHDGRGVFAGLPDRFEAGRYHSLAAIRVPDVLEVSATSDDGEVMASATRLPVEGVQFHPNRS